MLTVEEIITFWCPYKPNIAYIFRLFNIAIVVEYQFHKLYFNKLFINLFILDKMKNERKDIFIKLLIPNIYMHIINRICTDMSLVLSRSYSLPRLAFESLSR